MENFPSNVPAIVAPNIQIYLRLTSTTLGKRKNTSELEANGNQQWELELWWCLLCAKTKCIYKHILKEKRAEKPGDICMHKIFTIVLLHIRPHHLTLHSQEPSTKFSIATCVHLASAKNWSTPSCAAVDHLWNTGLLTRSHYLNVCWHLVWL